MKPIDAIKRKNYFGYLVLASSRGTGLLLLGLLLLSGGCAGNNKQHEGVIANPQNGLPLPADTPSAKDVKINQYLLSPGDEINITVFPQQDLTRRFIIPPDGHISYPLVGEIDVKGKSLNDLREIILKGFSNYHKTELASGDEISITVYRHDELARRFVIPPEGSIFYPLVGEVELQGKSVKQVRETLVIKLQKYINNPQVEVNLIKAETPKVVVNPQVSMEVFGFGGQKVFVLGEVNRPGVYLADGRMGIIEALATAGSLTLDAAPESILLIRGGMNTSKPELITLNLESYLEEDLFARNISLRGGDVIYVSRSFISNVDRFFEHLYVIVRPLLALETGIYVGQKIEGGANDGGGTSVPAR